MVVPGSVRGEDEVAAGGIAALALDDGVAALVGENGAAGVGRVQVHRRYVAGIVDRDRAADSVGDLQPAVEPGVEQEDALAVCELDGGDLCLARDLGDAVQVGGKFPPAPQMRQRLHLIGGNTPGCQLSAALTCGLAEPGALRRRVGLGAHPDIVLAGLLLISSISSRALLESPAGAFFCAVAAAA